MNQPADNAKQQDDAHRVQGEGDYDAARRYDKATTRVRQVGQGRRSSARREADQPRRSRRAAPRRRRRQVAREGRGSGAASAGQGPSRSLATNCNEPHRRPSRRSTTKRAGSRRLFSLQRRSISSCRSAPSPWPGTATCCRPTARRTSPWRGCTTASRLSSAASLRTSATFLFAFASAVAFVWLAFASFTQTSLSLPDRSSQRSLATS